MKNKTWLIYAIITTVFWGVWGAIIEIPEKAGFPATLGYSVWALTLILPALVALKVINWKLEYDKKSILLGLTIGLTGAGGQLILFIALKTGPAYLVFSLISLSPVVTILFAYLILKERVSKLGWIGISLALLALPLLSYQPGGDSNVEGYLWIILSLLVFLAWGFQGFVMRFANQTMKAESIYFYMTLSSISLIPFALWMTDFSQPINWGFSGPYLTAIIQLLNSVGALMLVYAFRYGKALVVSPMTNALAPVITIVISLSIYQVIPQVFTIAGMLMAVGSAFLLAIEEEE